jgi:DNA-binding NarL/FixJ family response regulator
MPSVEAVAPLVLNASEFEASETASDYAIFIGPQKSFTQTVLRILEDEIEGTLPVRHDSIADFLASRDAMTAPVRVIIVDAGLCDAAFDDLRDLAAADAAEFPCQQAPSLVIAYWSEAKAQTVAAQINQIAAVRGFLPMNQSIDIWLAVLRLFLSGGTHFPRAVQAPPPEPQAAPPSSAMASDEDCRELLTSREVAVMHEVVNGLQNKQIAAKLKVSEHTVKLHIHHIITKMQVSNRTAAAMKFVETHPPGRA